MDLKNTIETFSKWGNNQPNGRHIENCITLETFDGNEYVYNDVECKQHFCFACYMKVKGYSVL